MTEINDNNKNKKRGKKGWLVALIICILLAVGAIVYLIADIITQKKAQDDYDRLRQMTVDVTPTPTPVPPTVAPTAASDEQVTPTEEPTPTTAPNRDMTEIPAKEIDWDALHAENPDIYAWIYVPGTRVDYPILQHPTDDNFYLNHNVDGSAGYPGCVYTEKMWNTKYFDDPNTVLYSHNLRSGEMFSTLHYFDDPAFFAGDHYIYIYREKGEPLAYQIFGAYETGESGCKASQK